MSTDHRRFEDAAARYGPSVNHIAAQYTNPRTGQKLSGEALLLKLTKGESGFNMKAVSSAGARGGTQFMPGTRAEVIKRFGIDPWRSPEEAVHAAALHLRGKLGNATGLEGYNPGDSSYTSYILGQHVGAGSSSAGVTGGGATSAAGGPGAGSSFDGGSGLAAQLRALAGELQQPGPAPIPTAGLPAPSFAAAPVMPRGYKAPQSSVGVAPAPQEDPVSAQLAAIAREADAPSFGGGPGAGAGGGGGGGGGAVSGGGLRPGGGYDGSQGVAKGLAEIGWGLGGNSDGPGQQKRHNTNPYSGSRSDHDLSNKDAYAYDVGWGTARPTPAGDRAALRIMRELGDRTYRMGQPIDTSRGVFHVKTDKGTYRVQVIYRGSGARFGGNHLTHIHVGVKFQG